MTTFDRLASSINQALDATFGTTLPTSSMRFECPPDAKMGDFAFACFPLAKTLRRGPQQIASALAEALKGKEGIRACEAAGPYVNIHLEAEAWFTSLLPAALKAESDPESLLSHTLPKDQQRKVVVEFSCPNTNKPQHLGHVRNNILGQALSRLLKSIGHRVERVNLINDRGIHICRSMLAWQKWGEGATPESTSMKGDHFVGKYYVEFARRLKQEEAAWRTQQGFEGQPTQEQSNAFDKASKLNAEAIEMLLAWEAKDPAVHALWQRMNGWVFKGFDETYARMGIIFDHLYYESNTWILGRDLVDQGLKNGSLYKHESGAVMCSLDALKLSPKVLLRSNGTTLYMTQDLGTAVQRHEELDFDQMIYVVGNEQDHHFKVLFHILGRLGYKWAENLKHYSYGMVNLTSGKMKSREGRVVDADDLLDTLESSCLAVMEEGERRIDLNDEEKKKISSSLALGALKYFILKVNPTMDMIYNPEESIDLAGNTGPYLQYAHARIQSLVRKSGVDIKSVKAFDLLGQPEEIDLLKQMTLWPREVLAAAEGLNPSRIAQKTYELARSFSRFFNAHSVFVKVDDPRLAQQRVALCAAVGAVLKQGLHFMGMDAPERI
jgi:arginyl-tRNA synthetase